MNDVWKLVGVGAAVIGTGLLIRHRPRALVIWQGRGTPADVATFHDEVLAARQLYRTQEHRVSSAAEVLRAAAVPGLWDRVLLIGHGSARQMFVGLGFVDMIAVAQSLDLAGGAIVSAVGCRAAADPGTCDWCLTSYKPGGVESTLAKMRDAVQRGDVEWRGHSTSGHAAGNPVGRSFYGAVGTVGVPLMEQVWGAIGWGPDRDTVRTAMARVRRWNTVMRGAQATRLWALGGPLPQVRRPW